MADGRQDPLSGIIHQPSHIGHPSQRFARLAGGLGAGGMTAFAAPARAPRAAPGAISLRTSVVDGGFAPSAWGAQAVAGSVAAVGSRARVCAAPVTAPTTAPASAVSRTS